jgi:hypothetical protein
MGRVNSAKIANRKAGQESFKKRSAGLVGKISNFQYY